MGICHEMDPNTVDSNIAELEVFALTAERLWHDANGDGIGKTTGLEMDKPEVVLRYRNELMPFLNVASVRLRKLAEVFRRALWACYECNGELGEEDGKEEPGETAPTA